MSVKQILVLGGGFAGLWSAVGAARKLDELGQGPDAVEVTLANRDAFHSIRVRNYEPDLTSIRVPLDDVLGPVGVRRVEGEVTGIDLAGMRVSVHTASGQETMLYDRLVLALGSEFVRPNVVGLTEYAFDVDTYNGAAKLNRHLQSLPVQPESPGRFTVIVVGAGLTGVETAAEMPGRLRLDFGPSRYNATVPRHFGRSPTARRLGHGRICPADHQGGPGRAGGRDTIGYRCRLDRPDRSYPGIRRGRSGSDGRLVRGYAGQLAHPAALCRT